jgi:hypothetical protein
MLTKEQMDSLVADLGKQAAVEIKTQVDALDLKLDTKYKDVLAGTVTIKDFNEFKESNIKQLNEALKKLEDIAEANKAQAEKISGLLENPTGKKDVSMAEFLTPFIPKLAELKAKGTGYIEVTDTEMKAAGITSIGGSITPGTPYLPGLAGTPLEMFDIVQAPDFMITRVDLGTTDQYKLAWVNETGMEGAVDTNIAESGLKPLVQHKFSVEISTAEKVAAYSILTEEFEEDVPGLASEVRGMLQRDVMRALDNAIQTKVFLAAKAFNLTQLDADIYQASLWDAAYALLTQVGFNNFTPNTLAVNWITNAKMQMAKNANGTYLLPPFKQEILDMLVRANKIETNVGLAGDLKQFRVRMYKGYTLRMGWINDQFIKNEFAILGELRYHGFISDNRKFALAKGDLNAIAVQINGTPGS